MILQAPILALLLISALAVLTLVRAAGFAVNVLSKWDLASGASTQLEMERRTHLVSTALTLVLLAELAALVLFVYNADRMAEMFVGAMCAVGTLNVNAYGFSALLAKVALFFFAGLWLIVDALDRRLHDYPLVRFKYGLILALTPLVLASAGLELAYFLNLEADVITSCCSKLFTPDKAGLSADLSGLAPQSALILLAAGFAAVYAIGALFLASGRGAILFSLASAALFVAALVAIISVISLYVYEHPHHHCPFCLLQAEYNYFGYFLYLPLFSGTTAGLAPGVLALGPRTDSLAKALPAYQRRLVLFALGLFTLFGASVVWAIAGSALKLFG